MGWAFALQTVLQTIFQEGVRSALAILLRVLLWVTIAGGLRFVGGPHWANAKEFLNIVIPALSALLGSALGFYFGTRNGQGGRGGSS
jgi:uncharacterized membrane protein